MSTQTAITRIQGLALDRARAFGPNASLREDYLAIATIGIAEVLRRVTIEERWLVNGTRGLTGIPRPLDGWFEPADYKFVFLAIALILLVLVYLSAELGIRSPWGRVLRALREDEEGYPLPEFIAARVPHIREFIVGALIVAVLLLMPRGLLPEQARVSRWLESGLSQIRRDEKLRARPAARSESAPIE